MSNADEASASRLSRPAWPFVQRKTRSSDQADDSMSETSRVSPDTAVSDVVLRPTSNGQSNAKTTGGIADGAGTGARHSIADWEGLPPTDHQIRYIKVLGGDPADVRTKAEASELLDRLRRLRGPSPLDPYNLEKRGTKAGADAGTDWKAAHDGMLSGLRLDLQQYLDSTLDGLRIKLSDACGPGGVRQLFGPQNLVREAGVHLERLRVWRHHGQHAGAPIPVIPSLEPESGVTRANGRNKTPDEVATGGQVIDDNKSPDAADQPSWWGLVGVIAVCVMLESIFNIPLLMTALAQGVVGAFMLSVLVSLINVGGLGAGAGVVCSWLRRLPRATSVAYTAFFAIWLTVAMSFNLVAGRHREAYARIVEFSRINPTELRPSVPEVLPGISFNPLTWEFQALLFALLGLILCAFGFAKGFTFIKFEAIDDVGITTGTSGKIGRDGETDENGDQAGPYMHTHVVKAYEEVLNQFRASIGRLRADVVDWNGAFDQIRRDMHNTVNMLAEENNRRACIDCVTHAFIRGYNDRHVQKLDLAGVEDHRSQKGTEPVLVMPSDTRILEDADKLGDEWMTSGQKNLEQRIATAQEEMTALWVRYEPLVLGPRQDRKTRQDLASPQEVPE